MGSHWTHNWQFSIVEYNSGNSVQVRAPGGVTHTFKKSGSNYVPHAGVEATLVKNGGGDWTLTQNNQLVFAFDVAGKLTSVKDRNNNTTSLTYDGSSRLTTITYPGGRSLTLAYNAASRISSVTDGLGRSVTYDYDSNGNLTTVHDVKSGVTTYTYSGHLLTQGTDSNGHSFVRNTYDLLGRVVSQLDALGNMTTFEYSTPGDGATRMTDARGKHTTYYFDQSLRVTDVMDDSGNVSSFVFDSDNNRTCAIDPLGHKTGFTYDSAGNVTHVIDALNTDASCNLASGGAQSTYSYTAKNDVDSWSRHRNLRL